jgi:hypothetical protein
VFVVPSTSARNGRWQRREKAAYFQALRQFVGIVSSPLFFKDIGLTI